MIARLRAQARAGAGRQPVPAARCRTSASAGGRANAQYQYTLQADDLDELRAWEPRIRAGAARSCPSSPTSTPTSRTRGLQTSLVIDRDAAARLGVTPRLIDTTLNDAFGQRQVSTIYSAAQPSERGFEAVLRGYERTLAWALRPRPAHGARSCWRPSCLNVYLYVIIPKGFFPQQDTGRLIGRIQADQSISFQAMRQKLADFIDIVRADPAVENVVGFTGGASATPGSMFVTLKPLAEREETRRPGRRAAARASSRKEPGANLFLNPVQDIRVGGRQSNAPVPVHAAGRRPRASCAPGSRASARRSRALPELADVNTDQQDKGPADVARHRPRHRGAPRRDAAADRRHAERRCSASARCRRSTRRSTSTTS